MLPPLRVCSRLPEPPPPAWPPSIAALMSLSAPTWTQAACQVSGKWDRRSLALSPGAWEGEPWVVVKLEALQGKGIFF